MRTFTKPFTPTKPETTQWSGIIENAVLYARGELPCEMCSRDPTAPCDSCGGSRFSARTATWTLSQGFDKAANALTDAMLQMSDAVADMKVAGLAPSRAVLELFEAFEGDAGAMVYALAQNAFVLSRILEAKNCRVLTSAHDAAKRSSRGAMEAGRRRKQRKAKREPALMLDAAE